MDLHYRTYGSGKPLIILHGLYGLSDNWHTIAKEFCEQRLVIVPDLRNHGNSPWHPAMNYELMAKDIYKIMQEKYSEKSFDIIGHSMGGKIAMKMNTLFNNKIDKMIIVDVSPSNYIAKKSELYTDHLRTAELIESLAIETIKTRQEIEFQLKNLFTSERLVNFFLKNIKRSEFDRFSWKFNFPAIRYNFNALFGEESDFSDIKFVTPTLFIRGDRSEYILPEDELAINNSFKHVEIQTIENAGHWIHADSPDIFKNSVKKFLGL